MLNFSLLNIIAVRLSSASSSFPPSLTLEIPKTWPPVSATLINCKVQSSSLTQLGWEPNNRQLANPCRRSDAPISQRTYTLSPKPLCSNSAVIAIWRQQSSLTFSSWNHQLPLNRPLPSFRHFASMLSQQPQAEEESKSIGKLPELSRNDLTALMTLTGDSDVTEKVSLMETSWLRLRRKQG